MPHVIPAALKRDVILNNAMRAFKRRILPVMAFATSFRNVALQGTDKILVPYYPLENAASTDFNGTYVMNANSEVQTKEVTVNKRKYQSLSFTSVEWNRQPYLDIEKIVLARVEKLAQDVLNDIFSVITAAKYNAASIPAVAASAFDFDEFLAMRQRCNEDDWPEVGRAMVLDSAYDTNLLKDTRVHNQNYGSTDAVREGRVPRLAGFDYYQVPSLPQNAEKLVGMAVIPSALFVAFSPVQPAPAVRNTLLEYSIVTDPDSGLSLEYRVWGDPDSDKAKEVIECNYGFEAGETAALKRIVSP